MAEKHGIPKWLVSLSHLKGLLMSDEEVTSSEAVLDAIASSEVMTPLLEAAGDECWRRMDAELFPFVDGRDADAVWAFVALVDKVGGTASVFGTSKKQLKKVVEKLRNVALDFKVENLVEKLGEKLQLRCRIRVLRSSKHRCHYVISHKLCLFRSSFAATPTK